MQHCRVFWLLAAFLVAWASPLHAAPRDKAANEKIDEAINSHYLATEFDKAEAILKGTIEACEDRCSPDVKARAWMYVGVVRGSGKQNMAGAQEAFQQAIALDPNVKLDDALATPATRQAFADAAAALGQTPAQAATTPQAAAAAASGGEDVEGEMECTPSVSQVETSRPIPVACTTSEPAGKVQLKYKPFGSDTWQTVAMQKKGEYWQGEIPCADTSIAGTLRWYVSATDSAGDTVDSYASKKRPAEVALVNATDEEPPAYPGQAAPMKCMEASACPEDMIGTPACPGTGKGTRGNKGWGAPCNESKECEVGLLCTQGDSGRTCESAPTCDSDSDCPSDTVCKSGTCDLGADSGDGPSGPYKKNWFSLAFAMDIMILPAGTDVCTPANQAGSGYKCFYGDGTQYVNPTVPGGGGIVNSGPMPGTMRVLLGYERAFTPNIGAEIRAGFAFRGGPAPEDGAAFLPVHAEARGKYWFGSDAYARKGLRPYVFVGGGLAQVDAKLTVGVLDIQPGPDNTIGTADDSAGLCFSEPGNHCQVDAYKKLGTFFAGLGGGVMYAIAPNHGVLVNLNAMLMLPTTGFVLEPSIGYALGL